MRVQRTYRSPLPRSLASLSFTVFNCRLSLRSLPHGKLWASSLQLTGLFPKFGSGLTRATQCSGWVTKCRPARWLASTNRSMFDEASQRDRIAADLMIFSLLSFFAQYERDWQLQRTSYGALQLTQAVSRSEECTTYVERDLRQILISSGNVFAHAPLEVFTKVCLPPNTALRLTSGSTDPGAPGATFRLEWRRLTVENPFCRLSFSVEHPAHLILNVHPFRREYVRLAQTENRGTRYEQWE